MPLAGSRDSVPCGVWGNAPIVSRATSPKGKSNKGAGSEASLPVTKKPCNTAQSAWEATAEGVQRAIGKPSGSCSFYQYDKEINFGSLKKQTIFHCRKISPLRARQGGFPPHFSISITLRLNTARPWFFLSVRKRLSVFSSTAMSIGLERCMSMPASKLC